MEADFKTSPRLIIGFFSAKLSRDALRKIPKLLLNIAKKS